MSTMTFSTTRDFKCDNETGEHRVGTRESWRDYVCILALLLVSRGQTTFSSFIFGREEKGSGTLHRHDSS